MGGISYNEWEDQFEADAKKDDYALMDAYCQFTGSGVMGKGEPVMSGTKRLVRSMTTGYWNGPDDIETDAQTFLRMQRYNPALVRGCNYVIGIESEGCRGWARIIWDKVCVEELCEDLASFHDDYTLHYLVISKTNDARLTALNHRHIIECIESDLRSDYGQELKLLYQKYPDHLWVTFYGDTSLDHQVYGENRYPIKPGMRVGLHRESRRFTDPAMKVRWRRMGGSRDFAEGVIQSGGQKRLRVKLPRQRQLVNVKMEDVYYLIE